METPPVRVLSAAGPLWLCASTNPWCQVGKRSVHPSPGFAFSFEAPRIAWEEGKTDDLTELLATDATVYGDGGGKAPSVPVPLVGAVRIGEGAHRLGRQARERGMTHRPGRVNGEPGLVFYDEGGPGALGRRAGDRDGVVVAVRSVLNPDKLVRMPARGRVEKSRIPP